MIKRRWKKCESFDRALQIEAMEPIQIHLFLLVEIRRKIIYLKTFKSLRKIEIE